MLKISLVDNARQRRVIVEGKLIAPWTAELRNACQEARADLGDRELVRGDATPLLTIGTSY